MSTALIIGSGPAAAGAALALAADPAQEITVVDVGSDSGVGPRLLLGAAGGDI